MSGCEGCGRYEGEQGAGVGRGAWRGKKRAAAGKVVNYNENAVDQYRKSLFSLRRLMILIKRKTKGRCAVG